MKLSTRTRYGIRMLIELTRNYNKGVLKLNEIAKKENIAEKYLGQITIILKNNKIINSVRGVKGGFTLTKSPENFNLKDLVEILEGEINIVNCKENECINYNDCITKNLWSEVSMAIKNTLSKYTLQDLILMQNNIFYI